MLAAMSSRLVGSICLALAIVVATIPGAAKSRQRGHVRRNSNPATTSSPAPVEGINADANPAPGWRREPNSADPFERLPAITIANRNSKQSLTTRLYASAGQIDESAAARLDAVCADTRDPKQPKITHIDRRLLQLVFRTAYHFQASHIEITSAYRMPGRKREGLHALGRAIDFSILGVSAEALASYLRTLPRVGVGIYTHPRTRFVHLDVRERSYHWLDASPPGRSWRGMSIGNKSLPVRDAGYRREDDWPEGLPAPTD
jgi:uncharacterized protein YcbK (DUF882 family)